MEEKTNVIKKVRELQYRKKINPLRFHVSMPMQQKFSDDPAKFKCLFGANRSGKSEEAIKYVLNKMLAKPRQKWWICGESFQDSIAIQQTKMWSLVPKAEIRYGKFSIINGFTNRKLLLNNGSIATFKSYDQARESFQGDDVDGILNDEEPPFDIFQEQKMRLIDRDGEMLISMTSLKGITELIENIYEDHDVIESKYAPLLGKHLPRVAEKNGIYFFFLWSEENKYINQKRLAQEAKLMPRDEILCRIYGVPVNLSGRIYTLFSKLVHITTLEEMPEGKYTLFHILDPHDRKPFAMIWIAVHITGRAYVVDEYPNKPFTEIDYDDKTYSDYAAIIKAKEAHLKDYFGAVQRRIIDPNFGNTTIKLAERQGGQSTTTPKKRLQKLGLKFKDGIDALEAGHLAVREWLYYDTADNGEIIVQPKLFFCDNCTNSILGMSRYSRKDPTTPSGDEKDKVGPLEKWKDFPDAIRYGVMSGLKYIHPVETKDDFKKAY